MVRRRLVARRLFAENGVGPVTAGRIAREAGISPGNLYYWFDSKQAIVRALFSAWIEDSRPAPTLPEDPADLLALLWDRAAVQQRVNDDYAFFHRELLSLVSTDPVLAESYREAYAVRAGQFAALAERLVLAGLLRAPQPPSNVHDLVTVLWLIADVAGPFADATADAGVDAARMTRAVIGPLLTDAGRAVLGIRAVSVEEAPR